ncbi:MAG: hypothetical protein WCY11_06055 [Novosphingobium sp.]
MSITALLVVLATEAAVVPPVPVTEPNPKVMSQSEIRAFNATVSRDHPFYIRCVRASDTGSLVRKSYSCRTNQQWRASDTIGNQNARDTYEDMQGKAMNTSN